MSKRHCVRWLVCAALVLAAAEAGCLALHRQKTVTFLVRDAETRQPISGAEVKLMCLSVHSASHTPEVSGATGADGVVRLAAARGADSALVEGAARGYLTEEANVPASALVPANQAPAGKSAPADAADVIIEVYAEPRATVDLIVPSGYRGLVKVEVEIETTVPLAPGQRQFRLEVPPSGVVRLQGPPLLRHLRAGDYAAHYADGKELVQPKHMLDVGLRWLKCEVRDQYFVIGTQVDWDAARHRLEGPSAEHRPAEGGRGGGRGGHRHRGGGE